MHPLEPPKLEPRPNPYTGADVFALLKENHWLESAPSEEQLAWCDHAAALLGHYATDRPALAKILRLIFEFDATQIMQLPESHAVLARHAARDVIRHLALHLLQPGQQSRSLPSHPADAYRSLRRRRTRSRHSTSR
jgi:hypothetical protein